MKKLIFAAALVILSGCAVMKDHVLVNTETVLGLAVAQNQTSGMYEARLGYARHELAVVTTNVDVLTEMQFKNLFSFTAGPSLYQRMAIGKDACQASVVMFMKNPDGTLNPQAMGLVESVLKLHRSTND